ncbi:MAG: OmpH family outer membrane protein [Bacteroidales bacterium]|jgi:outer membrane protein|nr:OmpH family outer membrane protein [Bacteroidales bacterium]OQA84241.1 MAG: Outer membrane protein (OmpH-like) [Bacteroidetes bacterium ADurb.Bin234]
MDENINVDDTTVGKELTNENTQNDNIVVNQIQETEEIKEESITKDKRSCNTKKTCICQSIAFAVLFIGLIVLYIIHFQNKSDFTPLPGQAQNGTPLMVTVNNDSIIEHFTLAKILKNDLETEAQKYQQELTTMQSTLEEKYKNYQINLQKNVLTQTQIQNAEKQLQQEAGQFQALQEQYSQILAMKEVSVQKEITDSIVNAAQRVNDAKYKADYVLATSSGSAILYANKVYDITNDVIKELNDAYKKSSK